MLTPQRILQCKLAKIIHLIVLLSIFSISARGSSCPKNLTQLEEDGIISTASGEGRFKIVNECIDEELLASRPKVTNVRVKKQCKCVIGNWENFKSKVITRTYDFKVSKKEPVEQCSLGKNHIICNKPGPCYELKSESGECSTSQYFTLACPKKCLTWKEHK